MRRLAILCLLAPLVFLGSACGDDGSGGTGAGTDGQVCEPGKTESCACVGGDAGAQSCLDDGSGWGMCECPMGTSGGTSAGTSGGTGGATSGGGTSAGSTGGTGGSGGSTGGDVCDDGTLGGVDSQLCSDCTACAAAGPCAAQATDCNTQGTACNEVVLCFDACDQQCQGDAECFNTCVGGDPNPPAGTCAADYPQGYAAYIALLQCYYCDACLTNCNGAELGC